jgi:FtsP/CotA-like multicopper oxidase with cupredoxin domain
VTDPLPPSRATRRALGRRAARAGVSLDGTPVADDSAPRAAGRPLPRRGFLIGGAAIGAGAVLAGTGLATTGLVTDALSAGRGAGATGAAAASGTAAAASSAAGAWPQPAVRASAGGRLDTVLRVAEGQVPLATQQVRAVTYESSYPGPTIELRPGDDLAIDLVNDSGQPTNLHTHGLHVSPSEPADDVLLDITPGERYPYRYQLPADHPGGTFWYHAHRHLISDEQVFGGLFGAMVVRGALDELPGVAGLEERVMVLSQTEVVDGGIVPGDESSLSNQVTLVNGQYRPTLAMAAGSSQRWRLINTSSLFLRLELAGRPLHVIAVDGNALTAASSREIVEVPPGGRVDAIVQAATPGTTELRSLSWEPFGVFYTSMVPVPQTLFQVVVEGDASPPPPLPTTLLPFEDLRGLPVDRVRRFRLEEREPRGTGDLDGFRYFINGREFDHGRIDETVQLGALEEWELINLTYEPHPLHIHVNPFQVVEIDGQPVDEGHYRDSAMVPPFGSIKIRHRFEDFTGVFPMHCHILFHEDHGMMLLVEVVDGAGGGAAPGGSAGHH